MKSSRVSTVDWDRDVYAKGKQLNNWPYTELVSAIIREVGSRPRNDISVLEIGCGAGNNIWFLAEEGFKTAGIDISETAISYAKDRLNKREQIAELVVGDMLSLPWPENTFDIVIDRGAFTQNSHDRIRGILDEVLRVLKPTGIHFGFTLNGMNHPDRLFGEEVAHHTYDNFTGGSFSHVGLTSFFTPEDIYGLFEKFHSTEIIRHLMLSVDGDILIEKYSVRAFPIKR